jgi:hypothetical protein
MDLLHSDILILMFKFFLKFLIVVFLMESTWAVAAQYCSHELGLEDTHLGHHSTQVSSEKIQVEISTIGADQSQLDADKDCAYCHLGAMKSMVSFLSLPSVVSERPSLTAISYSYPDVTPRHPERPNWQPAA